ncbi:unnamed protein product [Paramecium sonneborni]|uniref:Uncharacterized protein n=1 Tax=Paramecium sonneborni TaxID=65129 RepID=A0A8S1MHD0_9CILI|nr:unnamed protein product [Paramecium sonneborni]
MQHEKFTNKIELMLLNQEIYTLRLLDSPNIIKMYQCISLIRKFYIIIELCNLDQKQLKRKQSNLVIQINYQWFLEQLKKGVINRHIKPSNIYQMMAYQKQQIMIFLNGSSSISNLQCWYKTIYEPFSLNGQLLV